MHRHIDLLRASVCECDSHRKDAFDFDDLRIAKEYDPADSTISGDINRNNGPCHNADFAEIIFDAYVAISKNAKMGKKLRLKIK